MHTMIKRMAAALLCVWLVPLSAAARELIPVGQVVGLELQSGTVTVAGFDTELGAAAREAGLEEGDVLLSVNGKKITCSEDVSQALKSSTGTVTVEYSRDGKTKSCRILPQITDQGPKLGLYLRQGITGIGTVTWYDPETGVFATLGHGVSGSDGTPVKLVQGSAYAARVVQVRKGVAGKPGQLIGSITSRESIGDLTKNTDRGVFGLAREPWKLQSLEVAETSEIRTGKATILSTVDGQGVREYSVDILKIYPRSRQSGRNLLIRVTDPMLLEATGGIVQGMSGSPILQNGKLIGAVTHVLVNDPTTGYGIFIENMLEAA